MVGEVVLVRRRGVVVSLVCRGGLSVLTFVFVVGGAGSVSSTAVKRARGGKVKKEESGVKDEVE